MTAPVCSLSETVTSSFNLFALIWCWWWYKKLCGTAFPLLKNLKLHSGIKKLEKKRNVKEMQVKEPVGGGGGKERVRMALGPLAVEEMLILASGISNWHFLKC